MALDGPAGATTIRTGRVRSLLVVAALIVAIGFIDYATGTELRVYPLYFFPTAEASWRLGRIAGIGVAIASSATWLVANLLAGLHDSSLGVTIANTGVQLVGFTVVAWLISAYRSALDAERRSARSDGLTGLANARAFYERAELEAARARRSGSPLAVAYLDLDGFKGVNDRRGHRAGDTVLATVGSVLATRLRSTDVAARIGGDEFAVLLPDTGVSGAQIVLDGLRAAIAASTHSLGHVVTASIGAAVFPSGPPDVDVMLAAADQRMYEAKRAGRDRLVVREVDATPPVV